MFIYTPFKQHFALSTELTKRLAQRISTYITAASTTIALATTMAFSGQALANAPIDTRENQAISRQVIDASAETVWQHIARVDGLENFIPSVFESTSVEGRGLGAKRICINHDGSALVEQVVAFDAVSMTLTYTLVEGGNFPIENLYNTVQVHPVSDTQSLLVWESKYDVSTTVQDPTMMQELTQGGLAMVTAGAKRYIESLAENEELN